MKKYLFVFIMLFLFVSFSPKAYALATFTTQDSFSGLSNLSWLTDNWVAEKVAFYKTQAESNLNGTTRTNYAIVLTYANSGGTYSANFTIYYMSPSDLNTLTLAGGVFSQGSGYTMTFILTNKTAPVNNVVADMYPLYEQYYRYNSVTTLLSYSDNIVNNQGNSGVHFYAANPCKLFKSPIVATNINQDIINNINYYLMGSGSGYSDFNIDGTYYSNSKANKFKYSDHFTIYSNDTEAPVITLNGEPTINLILGDTYTDLGATAIDNKDGDISTNVIVTSNVNPNRIGNYTVNYNVCDSSNNCSTITRNVNVTDGLTELDITGKYGVLFYFKNFQNLGTNCMVNHDAAYIPCFKFNFKYVGYFMYGTVYPPFDDDLIYEEYTNDGQANSIKIISYDTYKELSYYHIPSATDFREYGFMFYNGNLKENSKIKYNANLFNYIIFQDKYNSTPQEWQYTDSNGNNQSGTINNPPQAAIEYIDNSNLFDNINSFLDEQNTNLTNIKGFIDEMWTNLPTVMTTFLTFVYGFMWVGVLMYSIRK
jgi:hypothetical protein